MEVLKNIITGSIICGVVLDLINEIGKRTLKEYFEMAGETKPEYTKSNIQEHLVLILFWPFVMIYALLTGKIKRK